MATFGYIWLLLLALCTTGYKAASTDLQTVVEQLHAKLTHVETELDAYISTNSSDSDHLEKLELLLKPLRDEISEVDHELMKPALVERLDVIQDSLSEKQQLTQIQRMLAAHFEDFRPNDNTTNDQKPIDCQAAYEAGWVKSGVYRINPNSLKEMNVFCEQERYGGGWVVFQSRLDGREDFNRRWQDYKDGFGDLHGEHWLGNDNINQLTLHQDQKLKVELQHGGYNAYADYSSFSIGDEDAKYKLQCSGFSDDNSAGDALAKYNGMFFTTRDRDNDINDDGNCAVTYEGAWWYLNCGHNINAPYGGSLFNWYTWSDHHPVSATRMMLKKKGRQMK